APPSPLSSRAKPRDLQFRGQLLEMFSTDFSQQPSLKVRQHSRTEQPGIRPSRSRNNIRLTRSKGLIDTRLSKSIDITQPPQLLEHPRRKQIRSEEHTSE